ncbi:MAG TPA: copper-binding protein [bacterium]|nr:copper-binding protein [bacterium]
MRKFITTLSCILFLTSMGISLFAKEGKEKGEKKEKPKVDIKHAYGEITKLDLENYSVTIKQDDGTEITLKATTEKTKEMLKNLKVGDKVKAVYFEKDGELVIGKIGIPKSDGKKEHKKEKLTQ